MTDFNELAIFRLSGGSHENAEKGVCAMEAVAWLEGLPHSDHPECTCPVIASYVRTLNDCMYQEDRQALIVYLPRLVGTVSKEHEQERAEYLVWQAIKVFAPNALQAVGLMDHAKALMEADTLYAAAARAAYAAGDAAGDAAAAAYAARAAGDAAGDAAYAARAAAYAAYAARAAAYAARAKPCWESALATLDGVLNIGPKSEGFTPDTTERVAAYRNVMSHV